MKQTIEAEDKTVQALLYRVDVHPATPPTTAPARRAHPLSSAGRIRALHLEFQSQLSLPFLHTRAPPNGQGETLLSTKLLALGNRASSLLAQFLQRDESETYVLVSPARIPP